LPAFTNTMCSGLPLRHQQSHHCAFHRHQLACIHKHDV